MMKTLKSKKMLAALLSLMLSASAILGGCSNSQSSTPSASAPSGTPAAPSNSTSTAPSDNGTASTAPDVELGKVRRVSDQTLNFNFWAAYNANYQDDWEGMKCWQYLEEATGVHINWELYTLDEITEKRNILFAAADVSAMPDAFFRAQVSDAQTKRYGPEGLFLDIKDMVKEHAPNLCAALDERNLWSSICDPETGALYYAPSLNDSISATTLPKLFLNKKMMEAVGWDPANTPKTTDELYELLIKIRDNDANGNGDPSDEVGITSNGSSRIFLLFAGAFGINNRGRDDTSVDADPNNPNKVRFVYTSDDYRKMLSYIRKLYAEGLMDPDLFSLKTSSMVALGSQNQIFGLAYHNLQAASVNTDDYTYLQAPLTGPDGHSDWNTRSRGLGKGNFVISANCKDPVSLVKWIDNLFTKEGALMLYFGKEGVDYYLNDQGMPTYNDELLAQVSTDNPYDKVVSAITCYASAGVPGLYDDATFPGAECRGISYEATKPLEAALPKTLWSFNFTTEETENLNALKADILTNCHEVYRAKFITGELDIDNDEVWNNYVQEMEGLGLSDLVDIYQTALDRMNAQ